ncbi:AHH domain-containing protein [Hyalangium gracile]|uniref:AHH domain-containing protein n=1 Tax=Hyalangium gracile TaxID=394092 RepID=UPI001CCE498F|nr:AHH domain-containing protein [Hyalangium gracile]
MVSNIVAGVLGVWVLGGAGVEPGYNFLVLGGGGEPAHNEIALEKNALYFQRTLRLFGGDPATATLYFANGHDGQETVRYLGEDGKVRFKAPEIPHLQGPSTRTSFQEWWRRTLQEKPQRPIFLYFTGHGGLNPENSNNNYLVLWGERSLSVRALSRALDQLSPDTPVVAVMSQCYAGSFANFIYQGGDSRGPVAAQARCGFFATVKERTSVGCTPEVDEADYRDYSSSFFAGLSGVSRVGQPVDSADYDQDGRVSFAEAHAFAKVDGQTSDLPVSTSEVWLQRRAKDEERDELYTRPILEMLSGARPEQRHVIESLARRLRLEPGLSLAQNEPNLRRVVTTEEQWAYAMRLWMELINLGMEARVREKGDPSELAVLDRLLACEEGSWHERPAVAAFPVEEDPPEVPGLCVSGEEEGGTAHRIATRTSFEETEGGEPWTPRFEELFEQAGMSLRDPANLIYLRDHASPHPESYNREIFERLQATMEGCGDEETCAGVLRMALRRLAVELCTPDTPLSSQVSW